MSRRVFLPLLTILVLSGATFGGLMLSDAPTSWDDGLRHITMARVMRSEGISQTWDRFLFGGYLAEHRVDPWFGADISYIPFTIFSDTVGLKLYAVVALAALLLTLWYIIAPLKLPAGWVICLFLLTIIMPELYGRLLLARPFVWSTTFAILALDAVLRRRWIWLSCILCIATLFSQLFVFSLGFAVAGVAWMVMLSNRPAAMRGMLSILLGIAAGIALHPYPVNYIVYIATVFLRIPFEATSLNLGSEMYPGFLMSSAPLMVIGAMVILCVGAQTEGVRLKLIDLYRDGTLLIGAMTLGCFVFYIAAWTRIIDIFLPLLILLFARILKQIALFVQGLCAVSLGPLFPRLRGGPVLLIVLLVITAFSIMDAAWRLRLSDDNRALAHAAPLADIPSGSRVLNPEWFHFPLHVQANPHVRYATGIDNTFMAVTDRDAYTLLEVTFSPAARTPRAVVDTRAWISQLLEYFPSDYLVLSDGWGKNLLPLLRETPGLTELTESGARIEVFQIDTEEFGGSGGI